MSTCLRLTGRDVQDVLSSPLKIIHNYCEVAHGKRGGYLRAVSPSWERFRRGWVTATPPPSFAPDWLININLSACYWSVRCTFLKQTVTRPSCAHFCWVNTVAGSRLIWKHNRGSVAFARVATSTRLIHGLCKCIYRPCRLQHFCVRFTVTVF